MSTISNYYMQSQLSMAAYALNLTPGISGIAYTDKLQAAGMSEKQAEMFAETYTVIEQSTDSISGFSATLFESDGKQYLAIRGTETGSVLDLLSDGITDIGVFDGVNGSPQYQQLESFYQSLVASGKIQSGSLNVTGHSLGGLLAQMLAVDHAGEVSQTITFNAPGVGGIGAQLLELVGITPSSVPVDNITNMIAEPGWSATAGLGTLLGGVLNILIEDQSPNLIANHYMKHLADAIAVCNLLAILDPSLAISEIGSIFQAASNDPEVILENIVNAVGDIFKAGSEVGDENRDELYTRIQAIEGYAEAKGLLGTLNVVKTQVIAGHVYQDNDEGLAYRYALVHLNPFAITGDASIYSNHNEHHELDYYNPTTEEGKLGTLTIQYLKDRAQMLTWLSRFNISDKDYSEYLSADGFNGNFHYTDYSTKIFGQPLRLAIDGDGTDMPYNQIKFGSDAGEPIEGVDNAGGVGNYDHLYGGAGNDTLQGKGGNDYLEGGVGNDTYIYNTGDGLDTILDVDGYGSIKFDGTTLSGGDRIGDNLYQSEDGKITYTFDAGAEGMGTLFINQNIKVENFKNGDLGIALGDYLVVNPQITIMNTIIGDGENKLEGTSDNDHIIGTVGREEIIGYGGDDLIEGGEQEEEGQHDYYHEILIAGDGDDVVYAYTKESRDNIIHSDDIFIDDGGVQLGWYHIGGGYGDDWLFGSNDMDDLYAGPGDDQVWGGAGDDKICGSGVYVYVPKTNKWDVHFDTYDLSLSDDDVLYGGAGNDSIWGNGGDDIISGGSGEDSLSGDLITNYDALPGKYHGDDIIDGGAGNDGITGDGGDDLLYGGDGDDLLYGDFYSAFLEDGSLLFPAEFHGNDTLFGGNGNDTLIGGSGNDELFGGDGVDALYGDDNTTGLTYDTHGDDYLDGGKGNDLLVGNGGNDALYGGEGDDELQGDDPKLDSQHHGDDILDGGAGADALWGFGGSDILIGGDGDDELYGDNDEVGLEYHGNDTLDGGAGDDMLAGYGGDDVLSGGSGNDELWGQDGNDILDGGTGSDILQGGDGDDTYLFSTGDGVDYINDSTIEKIAINGDIVGYKQDGNTSAIYYGSGDVIILQNGSINAVKDILVDGERINIFDYLDSNNTLPVQGTAGNDIIDSSNIGSAVSIYSVGGDDIILLSEPGVFNVKGGAGNDQYVITPVGQTINLFYGPYDFGTDSILIKGNYTSDQLYVTEAGNSLKLIISDNAEGELDFSNSTQIIFDNYFLVQPDLSAITFDSGETIPFASLVQDSKVLGDDAANTIYGTKKDDVFLARKGDDTLYGMGGNDTFIYRVGDGNDTINIQDSEQGINTLELEGISAANVLLRRENNNDLVVHIADGSVIRIVNHFWGVGKYALDKITFKGGPTWEADYINAAVLAPTDGDDLLIGGSDDNYLYGAAGNDQIEGRDGDDTLNGEAGNDTLMGGLGNDTLIGGIGADIIDGDEGSDVINGGAGDDSLDGGAGNDVYIYSAGDGDDEICNSNPDSNHDDSIVFDASIDSADVLVRREDNDLVLYWKNNQIIKVRYHFSSDNYSISSIRFADGTEYDKAAIESLVIIPSDIDDYLTGTGSDDVLAGLGGDDVLSGGAGNDTLSGDAGDDRLYGEEGDDWLRGGAGDDLLMGGEGSDTYEYQTGDGCDKIYNSDTDGAPDRIVLGPGIASDQVILRGDPSSLNIYIDKVLCLTVTGHFIGSSNAIDGILFDDGTYWDQTTIAAAILVPTEEDDSLYGDDQDNIVNGLGGYDKLSTFGGDDTLIGGLGDDELRGGTGSDTYHFTLWDGVDSIIDTDSDADSTDTLVFDSSVDPADMLIQRMAVTNNMPDDLVFTNRISGDQIILENYYSGYSWDKSLNQSDKLVQFQDGTVWTDADFRAFTSIATVGSDQLIGDVSDDTISGLGGDDQIRGGDGDDVLIGGRGNDYLYGGNGNNTYIYQSGDGFDVIDENSSDGLDILELADINPDDVWLHYGPGYFEPPTLSMKDGSGAIVLGRCNYGDLSTRSYIDAIHFADGTQWDVLAMEAALVASTTFDDTIRGTDGDDDLNGMTGNDLLMGGDGNDTYHFSRGDGVDVISDSGGVNTISFSTEITSDDVVFWRDPKYSSLFIRVKGEGQQIEVEGVFSIDNDAPTYEVVFTSGIGDTLSYEDLLAAPDFSLDLYYQSLDLDLSQIPLGTITNWDNTTSDLGIFTTTGDDSVFFDLGGIWAGEGDDVLVASQNIAKGNGRDEIDGGLGNDVIYAGGGDSQIFGGPDGADHYYSEYGYFTETDNSQDEHLYYWEYNCYGGVPYPEGVDENDITNSAFPYDGNDDLYAEGGDDALQGGFGNDLLVGGHGDDLISGGEGDDTYLFNLGDGQDRITTLEGYPYMVAGFNQEQHQADFSNDKDRIVFGDHIDPNDVVATQEGVHLKLSLGQSLDSITIERFFSADPALQHAVKEIEFHDGTIWNLSDIYDHVVVGPYSQNQDILNEDAAAMTLVGDDAGNILVGNSSDNSLTGLLGDDGMYGGAGNDQLFGGTGDDVISGQSGDDYLVGGTGDDYLIGGNQNDTYFFSSGFGRDIIDNYDDTLSGNTALGNFATDTIVFDSDIDRQNIQLARQGDDLVITCFADELVVKNHFLGVGLGFNQRYAIDAISFTDGTVWGIDDINAMLDIGEVNHAPKVAMPLPDQTSSIDALFAFQVPEDTFSDPDVGDTLSLSAGLSDGSPLPVWLSFDSATNTLSGTPDNSQVGSLEIHITATDSHGESVSDIFTLNITNENNAPVVEGSVPNQTAIEDQFFSLALSEDLFSDADAGDSLVLSVCLVGGAPLPGWLSFNPESGVLKGMPGNDDVGEINVSVIAVDQAGAKAEATFNLNIINVNDAPELMNALIDVNVLEGDTFNYAIPGDAFRDIDIGDSLSCMATLADGDSLPVWMTFDFDTWTFTGEVPMDAAGEYDIAVRVMDQAGATVSDSFHLSVTNLVQNVTMWNRFEGTSFNDLIIGGSGNEWLFGYDGNDELIAGGGNDILDGGAGNDMLYAGRGDDILDGRSGNDVLNGGDGSDILWGGRGDDYLYGGTGMDALVGGGGDDVIRGDDGDDQPKSAIERDAIYAWYGSGPYSDSSSNDTLWGGQGNDQLYGDAGNDAIDGGSGNDILGGGVGDDTLIGGSGSDIYRFSMHDGRDVIDNYDAWSEDIDRLSLEGIASDDLSFSRQWSNLVIDVVSTGDKVTVKNWFRGEKYQLDLIETSDLILQNDQVNQLVNAMAVFHAQPGFGSVVPQEIKDVDRPMFVSPWH